MIDRSAEQEIAFDRLDDQGQFDAATIREMTGYKPDGINEDFSTKAITARAGGNLALKAIDGAEEHEELDKLYGRVICANCNRPGCRGCGKS